MKSPYILEVYKYDVERNEYYAEYADQTLYDFINKNNNKITADIRINIVNQLFKSFSYIHQKGYLYRDISLTNVLLKKYDEALSNYQKVIKSSLRDATYYFGFINNIACDLEIPRVLSFELKKTM